MDGSAAYPGPFKVRHGPRHCTIQLNRNIIVVTGGRNTGDLVTQYHLTELRLLLHHYYNHDILMHVEFTRMQKTNK